MIAGAFALCALLLGALSLRHARWSHVATYLGSIACVAAGLWFAMGSPRPVWFGHKPGITILAMAYSEGQWITFLTRDGAAIPVLYILPWSEQKAAQAQQAMQAAKQAHTTVRWGAPHGGRGADGQRGTGTAGHSNGSGGASAGGGVGNAFSLAPHHALPPKEATQ